MKNENTVEKVLEIKVRYDDAIRNIAKYRAAIDDLKKELAEKRNDLLQAKRSHAAGELVNPKALRSLRKEIARLLTQINNTKESK